MGYIKLNKSQEEIPILGMGTYGIFPGESEKFYERWKKLLRANISHLKENAKASEIILQKDEIKKLNHF
ncbi:MAG: hypothetical protein R6W84_01160 [Promethearchaeia archaeon]